jgi:hypothetical protein
VDASASVEVIKVTRLLVIFRITITNDPDLVEIHLGELDGLSPDTGAKLSWVGFDVTVNEDDVCLITIMTKVN